MKLSSSLIFEKLRQRYPNADFYGQGLVLVRAPMLYNGQKLSGEYAYIVSPEDVAFLKAHAGNILFICTRSFEDISDCEAIAVNEQISPVNILNDLTEIFLEFHQWDEELSLCSHNAEGICRMLDMASELMDGYLFLVDAYYNYVAKSANTVEFTSMFDPEDPTRPSQEVLRSLVDDPVIHQIIHKKGATLYYGNSEDDAGVSLFVNLFREGEYGFSYRILFVRKECRYLPWHYHFLEHLAIRIQRISDVLSLYDYTGKNLMNLKNLLLDMLESSNQNRIVISANLQAVSWSSEDRYEIWVFYPFILGQSPGSNTYILSFLERMFHSSCALLIEDTIVLMRNVTRSIQKPEIVRNQMSLFLKDNLYKVGISSATENFGQIRSAYIQARDAYRLGSVRNPDYWYYKFEDYILDYVVYKCTEEVPVGVLCPREFQILQEYDRKHETELLKTLRIYIQEKYNATHAAEKLFIHRTTFLDRLERIKTLTQLNLDNLDARLQWMLAFRMLEG